METKQTHFKMYKSGRKWVFACALVLAMGGSATVAHADANASLAESNAASGQVVSDGSSSDVTSDSSSDVAGTKDADGTQTQGSNAEDTSQQQDTQNQSKSDEATQNDTQDQQQSGEEDADSNTQKNESEDQNTAKSGVTADSESLSLTDADKTTNDAKQNTTDQSQQISPASAMLKSTTRAVNAAVANGGNVYDDYPQYVDNSVTNILGVSSQFHIFANEATLNAHTNGNVAVGLLHGQVNFGTNIIEELLDKDISYIQDFTNLASSSFVSAGNTRSNKVIFGENAIIDVTQPDRPLVNNVYIDHLLSSEVYQDKNGNVYIDFATEFKRLKATNQEYGNKPSVADYTSADFPDMNNRVIDVSDMTPDENGHIIINLSPEVLQSSTPITIKGLSPKADGNTVVINVDTGSQPEYSITSQVKLQYSDGSDRDNQETEHFGDNHLLWNFIDRNTDDLQYTGTISVDRPFQGSILAPSAEVIANQNVDGNIVADKVVVNAETHRWDLQDDSENPNITRPDFELPDISLPNVELPGIENPGTVTPEVPVIEEPEEPEEPGDIQKPDIENPSVELPGVENPGTVTPEVPVNPEEPTTEEPNTEEPTTEEPGEETEEPAEELDEEGPDEGSYEHQHADDEIIDEYEEDFEEANTVAEKEALLEKIDAAIAQAQANHDSYLVTQLQAIRAQILKALGYGNGAGLPQTSEAHSGWAQILGLALAGTTLGGWLLRRKREN